MLGMPTWHDAAASIAGCSASMPVLPGSDVRCCSGLQGGWPAQLDVCLPNAAVADKTHSSSANASYLPQRGGRRLLSEGNWDTQCRILIIG